MNAAAKTSCLCGIVVVSVVTLVGQTSTKPAAARAAFAVESLASPAGADSAQAQLTVEGDRVILSWLETTKTTTLKFAERSASGWSAPRLVTSGDNLIVNSADVPSVRALPDGSLVAHWLVENGPDPEAYDLQVSWSKDGGRTWSSPTSPHHDGTITQHGFASFFPMAGGGFGVIWLDGRATNAEALDVREAGAMTLRAATYGPDGVQRGETLVASRACECCPTSSAVTAEGPIVAFRSRSTDEVRDIHVSRLTAGRWSAPTPVHRDGWKINGCPVNGPAVSARGPNVAVAWFTVQKSTGRAFAAFSNDAGRTFAPPISVDDGVSLGRPQIAVLKDGSAAVSWIEFAGGRSQLKGRRIDRSGARSAAVTLTEGLGTQFPRMVEARGELVFAWAEDTRGTTRVRTARAPLGDP